MGGGIIAAAASWCGGTYLRQLSDLRSGKRRSRRLPGKSSPTGTHQAQIRPGEFLPTKLQHPARPQRRGGFVDFPDFEPARTRRRERKGARLQDGWGCTGWQGEPSTSRARTVAAPRVSTPSFSNISCTCFLTVFSVMPRIVAMSELVLPCESQSSVSVARAVRPNFNRGLTDEKSGLNSRMACCWERRSRASMARTRSALANG